MSANMHLDFGGGTMDETTTTSTAKGVLAGNKILTMDGYRAVEVLKAGDRLITRNGVRVLRGVSIETSRMRPVRIRANTLGFSRPNAEMFLAPGQEVMVRDWRAEMLFGQDFVIMPVHRILDGKYIAEMEDEAEVAAYTLCFDEEEIFYADGVELISGTSVKKTATTDFRAAA